VKAAWQLSIQTGSEARERVELADECNFDTVILPDPTPETVAFAADRGIEVVAIVGAYPSESFREAHPDALQRLHPVEEGIRDLLEEHGADEYRRLSHRQYPVVHGHSAYCFEHPASMEALEDRVAAALEVADGVAFDGFGFRNGYACFCERCRERRERVAREPGRGDGEVGSGDGGEERGDTEEGHRRGDDPALLARLSERTLVETTARLYEHAKSVDPDALVTNHVWPPFRPDPYYAHRLRLDYCSQTIAWFYGPNWRAERVEFEAATHARLATSDTSEFAPFIGMRADPELRRSPERLDRELEIAARYGGGDLVFATLEPLAADPDLRAVVRDALA